MSATASRVIIYQDICTGPCRLQDKKPFDLIQIILTDSYDAVSLTFFSNISTHTHLVYLSSVFSTNNNTTMEITTNHTNDYTIVTTFDKKYITFGGFFIMTATNKDTTAAALPASFTVCLSLYSHSSWNE